MKPIRRFASWSFCVRLPAEYGPLNGCTARAHLRRSPRDGAPIEAVVTTSIPAPEIPEIYGDLTPEETGALAAGDIWLDVMLDRDGVTDPVLPARKLIVANSVTRPSAP